MISTSLVNGTDHESLVQQLQRIRAVRAIGRSPVARIRRYRGLATLHERHSTRHLADVEAACGEIHWPG